MRSLLLVLEVLAARNWTVAIVPIYVFTSALFDYRSGVVVPDAITLVNWRVPSMDLTVRWSLDGLIRFVTELLLIPSRIY